MGSIDLNIHDGVATIVINNPEKMNCINMSMLQDLDTAIKQIQGNKAVRVVRIQGAGEQAFSTGANLKEFTNLDQAGVEEWIKYGNQLFNNLEALPVPILAVINGYALGGGFELALACDFRVVSEKAQFAFPELKHGWIPGWGGLSRLRRLIGEPMAKQIILLGEMVNATTALHMGIANKICRVEELDEVVTQMLSHLKSIDPLLLEITKNALRDPSRGTSANDLLFDVLASQYSKKKN